MSEEVASGLYPDAYTVGWVVAIAALSDLAAVGADPVGVLLTSTWGPDWPRADRASMASGFAAALRASGTALLGGDSSTGAATVLSAKAIGCSDERPMSRVGAQPGDVLCTTGAAGAGAALGLKFLIGEERGDPPFRPRARLAEGSALRRFASACIDTSDGLLQAVAVLASVNGLGAQLEWSSELLDAQSAQLFDAKDLPRWLIWLSELGDYELMAAIPEELWPAAQAEVGSLIPLGRFTAGPEVGIDTGARVVPLDLDRLASIVEADPSARGALLAEIVEWARREGLP